MPCCAALTRPMRRFARALSRSLLPDESGGRAPYRLDIWQNSAYNNMVSLLANPATNSPPFPTRFTSSENTGG
jgi:hypothetical protein